MQGKNKAECDVLISICIWIIHDTRLENIPRVLGKAQNDGAVVGTQQQTEKLNASKDGETTSRHIGIRQTGKVNTYR